MEKTVAQVVVALPVEGPFDYSLEPDMRPHARPGMRVHVPFGGKQAVGVITGMIKKSRYKNLKSVSRLLDIDPALDQSAFLLSKDMAGHYGCSLGEALFLHLPPALRKKRSTDTGFPSSSLKEEGPGYGVELVHTLSDEDHWPLLIERLREGLRQGRGAIILVPDQSTLNRVSARLQPEFNDQLAVFSPRLTAKKEMELWCAVRAGRYPLALGMRSCVFAPVRDLSAIIMINEDSHSYKEEQSPYYHARNVARMRAKRQHARLVFVSAAPSAEAWHMTASQQRINIPGTLGAVQLIDLSNYKTRKRAAVSFPLINHLQSALENNRPAVVFLNRKGFSTMTRCNECGHILCCPRCEAQLVAMQSRSKLVCSLCGYAEDIPKTCPGCSGKYLRSGGTGTERIENDLARLFPHAGITHYDSESKRIPAKPQLVVATQAFLRIAPDVRPGVTGLLDADRELSRSDFRGAQRLFSLLIRLRQVSDKLVVQTFEPANPVFKHAREADFGRFYREELRLRKELDLPPFGHMVAVALRGTDEQKVFDHARDLYEKLKARVGAGQCLDPQPDPQPKLRDKYRFTIMIKTSRIGTLLKEIKPLVAKAKRRSGVVVMIHVDP